MDRLFIPALRGIFGDWVFYSCLISAKDLANRVDYATVLHKNARLSELIQREIKKKRGAEIADYLNTQNERFFNSLVIGVYDGSPVWHEFGITSKTENIRIEEISDNDRHSFGYLQFDGTEKLFAIDGQHRLAGFKTLFEEGNHSDDQVSVILVAHKETKSGRERTRRLFTTLNKTAITVSKGERIALDENDVMAIIVRRLVEDTPDFAGSKIAYQATNNLKVNDLESLTTIGNLYDVLTILFSKIHQKGSTKHLQFSRPPDSELDGYYTLAIDYFAMLRKHIPELDEYFKSSKPRNVVLKYRGDFGGSIAFRPLGLIVLTNVIEQLARTMNLDSAINLVAKAPRNLMEIPFQECFGTRQSKQSNLLGVC